MKTLWNTNKPLTEVGLLMLPILALALIGLVVDLRLITGAPAWLKPAKFAISIAIYTFTFAWMFRYLRDWHRVRTITGWITAITMMIEIGIICAQAARGTISHYNARSPLDAALFSIMGVAILLAWGASVAIAIALFREPSLNSAMGWALRLGMLPTVFGSATGGLMVTPTKEQLSEARITHQLPISGAHTVGAPDGGPGIPRTGWSLEHGDLRVPHFLGMHAMQVLPFLAWILKPNRPGLVFALSAGYADLFVALLAQALAGVPLLRGA